jgi:hypothetical protein
VNTPEEREQYLVERGLVPPLHRQLEARAAGVRLARQVCNLTGAARRRSEALEAKYRVLAIRARAGHSVEWPDD